MDRQQLKEIGMTRKEWDKLQSEVKFYKKLEDLEYVDDGCDIKSEMLEVYRNTGRTYTGKKRGRKPAVKKEC